MGRPKKKAVGKKKEPKSGALLKVGMMGLRRDASALPDRTPGEPFKPTPLQKLALAAVSSYPELASSRAALSSAIGCHQTTIDWWHKDPAFRQWWGLACRDISYALIGPASLELHAIISNPEATHMAKVKAVETLLKVFGRPKVAMVEAVSALLERWGKNPEGRLQVAQEGDRLAVELDARSGHSSPESARAQHNSPLSEPPEVPASIAAVPPEAMQIADPEALSVAAQRITGELKQAAEDGQHEDEEIDIELEKLDRSRGRRLPKYCDPPELLGEGVGENHGAPEGEQQRPAGLIVENLGGVLTGSDLDERESEREGSEGGYSQGPVSLLPPNHPRGYESCPESQGPRIAREDPPERSDDEGPTVFD